MREARNVCVMQQGIHQDSITTPFYQVLLDNKHARRSYILTPRSLYLLRGSFKPFQLHTGANNCDI